MIFNFKQQRPRPDVSPNAADDDIFSDPRKELALSALLLTNRRVMQQKQKQMEHEHQKQMKNMSRQQLEIKLHQHQYPHPTPQQLQLEQQHLQVMYGQNSVSLYPNINMPVHVQSGFEHDVNSPNDIKFTSGYIQGIINFE